MDFKVDYETLYDMGGEVIKEDENLVTLFSDLIKIIEELNAGWVGPDYENFKTISTTYIKDLKKITDEIDYIAGYMQKAANSYSEKDNGWKNTMRSIGEDQYEHR